MESGGASSSTTVSGSGREQDRLMPIANVIRMMRKVLPAHVKIADDAKDTIQECVSEFISFVTSEANDRCQREQRRTITAEDIMWAMLKLGFDDYIEPLSLYLQRFRELEGGDHRCSSKREFLPLTKKDPFAIMSSMRPSPLSSIGGIHPKGFYDAQLYDDYEHMNSATSTTLPFDPFNQQKM
ncbi:hypothetical protein GOP47_0006130 [Adiantum capillus-veneris]|uniref:Transcription factor CBF/NF-Y/archaeal histone domain-containing protein n=1 Tax=Adiantum capillus-veneris TaxID=13818 RepID=A0A9D4ZK41_ADICA|nr:hypothetical protein GOP47_0006130 [Adiantum capillus-veneris]